jgi:hypothetical protein
VTSTSNFSEGTNDALRDCERAHNLYLTIRDEINQIPSRASSALRNYCSIGLHVNSALNGSIETIGHGGNMVNRLR